VQRRMDRVAAESWDARLIEVFENVQGCLKRVENPIEQPVEIRSH
jgi:hypothetical protein